MQQRIAQGELLPDAMQARVACKLDLLCKQLLAWQKGRGLIGRIVSNKTRQTTPRGLYLWGKPGGGKSMLMDMFFQRVCSERTLATLTRRRTHFLPFMDEMHQRLKHLNRKRTRDPLTKLAARVARESRLLCFDELVVEDIADAMLLGRLFAALAQQKVVLVATSNFAPEELYKDGLKRENFLPFLTDLSKSVVAVPMQTDSDYRSRFFAQQGKTLWFSTNDGKERMQETFVRFVENTIERQTLPCEGRAILLERTGSPSKALCARGLRRSVVWCGFSDLCQTPRGVRDYNALLARCDVLFLADFPLLDETQRNGAKRFMRLIDLFYERRALVLCHSPARSPRTLYSGESHAKEFRRTASRLEEMMARAHALLEDAHHR